MTTCAALETIAALKASIRNVRALAVDIGAELERLDEDLAHEARRDIGQATGNLFAAWSKLRMIEKREGK